MPKVIGFNTGRLYQADGQRISVTLSKDNQRVLFNDHSRGISGALKLAFRSPPASYYAYYTHIFRILADGYVPRDYEVEDLAHSVMRHYDRGRYAYDPEADSVKADDWGSPLKI